MPEECDCDAWAQRVYEMSCRMTAAFEKGDTERDTAKVPQYIRSVVELGKACPEKAGELKQDYEQRLHTHNATAVLLTPGQCGVELTKRDRMIAQEVVRSNLQYDQEVLRSKMGWGQWLASALSQRPRW
jgi:hypothetical protein